MKGMEFVYLFVAAFIGLLFAEPIAERFQRSLRLRAGRAFGETLPKAFGRVVICILIQAGRFSRPA